MLILTQIRGIKFDYYSFTLLLSCISVVSVAVMADIVMNCNDAGVGRLTLFFSHTVGDKH